MKPHARHDGAKEKYAAYQLDQDLEVFLGRARESRVPDPEPVLSEV